MTDRSAGDPCAADAHHRASLIDPPAAMPLLAALFVDHGEHLGNGDAPAEPLAQE